MKKSDEKKAKILSKFNYDKKEDKKIVNDFTIKLYTEIDLLLTKNKSTYKNTESYTKQYIDKSINKLKQFLPELLYDSYNISINDLESDVIDVNIFINMKNEIKTIKEGDTVLVIVGEPFYNDKFIPTKRYILEFKVLSLDCITKGMLGITAHESPFDSMIDLEWCELVVKKESYEMLIRAKE